MRLANGTSYREGRVEIYYDGEWGTVCDDDWDLLDAAVVCRMLGFPGVEDYRSLGAFGPGSGEIVLDNVQCNGTEQNVLECEHSEPLIHNCRHTEDAGAVCMQRGEIYQPGQCFHFQGKFPYFMEILGNFNPLKMIRFCYNTHFP